MELNMPKKMCTIKNLLTLIFLLLMSPQYANAEVNIRWATHIYDNVTTGSNAVVGFPDGQKISLVDDATIKFAGSRYISNYSNANLMSFLSLSDINLIKNADLLIIECNGAYGNSFETSTWFFEDGLYSGPNGNPRLKLDIESFSPVPYPVIANGNISRASYSSFFNVSNDTCPAEYVYLLIDLSDLINRDTFIINYKASKMDPNHHVPDIESLGVIEHY